jgi:hypothetical protein
MNCTLPFIVFNFCVQFRLEFNLTLNTLYLHSFKDDKIPFVICFDLILRTSRFMPSGPNRFRIKSEIMDLLTVVRTPWTKDRLTARQGTTSHETRTWTCIHVMSATPLCDPSIRPVQVPDSTVISWFYSKFRAPQLNMYRLVCIHYFMT